MTLLQLKWAALRLAFYGYIIFSLFSVVGGIVTGPLMTYFVFGDWRFWKYLRHAVRFFRHGVKIGFLILRGRNNGFMFSVRRASRVLRGWQGIPSPRVGEAEPGVRDRDR